MSRYAALAQLSLLTVPAFMFKKKKWEKNPNQQKKKELETEASSLARPTFHYIFSLWFYFSQYNSRLTVSLFVHVEIKFNWSRILCQHPLCPFQIAGFSILLLQSCFMLGGFFVFKKLLSDIAGEFFGVLCSNWKFLLLKDISLFLEYEKQRFAFIVRYMAWAILCSLGFREN